MKKIVIILLVISIFSPLYVQAASKARTLRELKAELAEWKRQQNVNEQNKEATKNEISSAKNSVSSKQNEIQNNQRKVSESIEESARLTKEIEDGKESLANILKAYQIANGENVYLEYIFSSSSYEDLVYRYAIMESIMKNQNKKIDEWKDKIDYNTKLKADLEKREIALNKQIDSLSNEIDSLGHKLDDYFDISMDIKDEIASTQELINYYKKIGCKDDEDLNECVRVRGDTSFRKPLTKGTISSYFGYRTHPVTGKRNSFHSGTDIAGNHEGTSVYSVANGMVGKIIRKASCGGNQVYIYHTINGKKYTSAYLHLLNINVKVGDKVGSNTVIGTVGGGKGTRAWERCSTGAHLHLGLGNGWYGSTYTSYSTWKANLLDAKKVMKLPDKGKYWYSR